MGFPPCPETIRPVAHLLRLAEEHDERNLVVAYWTRIAAVNLALQLVPGKKPPEVSALLGSLLDWLERTKKENADNDGIVSETAAQAIIEEYALSVFDYCDKQDRASMFNKRLVKLFYTSTLLFDVLEQFGPNEELEQKRKYAKWKATYIHTCLKEGKQPIPGDPSQAEADFNSDNALTDEERKLNEDNFHVSPEDVNYGNVININPANNNGNNFIHAPVSSPVTPVPSNPIIPTTVATPNPAPVNPSVSLGGNNGTTPTPEQIQQAQKHCKFATSALNYDDVRTAVDNLEKALKLLKME